MAKLRQVEARFGRVFLTTPDTEALSRQESGEPTHIAFGSKVKIPAHVRKSSSRDSSREGSGSRTSRSSHSRTQIDLASSTQQGELEASWNSVNPRSRLNSESEPDTPKPQLEVEAAQQCLQPRPPKTGSAGQTKRRPVRVRSGGKSRTQDTKTILTNVSTTACDESLQSVDFVESIDTNNNDQNNNIEKIEFSVEDKIHKSESLQIENTTEEKQDLLSSDELSQHIQNMDLSNASVDSVNSVNSSIDEEISSTMDRLIEQDNIGTVFTFSSRPRSAPRSPKPRQNNEIEVNISKEETNDLSNSDCLNSRGARYEDDFFKHSSESSSDEDEGIQRLLQSSMSPRGSPRSSKESTPLSNEKRKDRKKKKKTNSNQLLNSSITSVSIKSSLLREIPSPRKKEEETYNAKNYQSDSNAWKNFPSTASSWMFDMSNANTTHSFLERSNLVDKFEQDKNAMNGHHSNLRSSLGSKEDSDSEIEDRDDGDNTLSLSSSDETTVSTWRPPPSNIRAHRYQDEMKPPGPQPDLTATLPMDARVYAGAFSPPIILPSEINAGVYGDMRNGLSVILSPPAHSLSNSEVDSSAHVIHEDELDLLYDPCLNCYFDPKTCKYYELS